MTSGLLIGFHYVCLESIDFMRELDIHFMTIEHILKYFYIALQVIMILDVVVYH